MLGEAVIERDSWRNSAFITKTTKAPLKKKGPRRTAREPCTRKTHRANHCARSHKRRDIDFANSRLHFTTCSKMNRRAGATVIEACVNKRSRKPPKLKRQEQKQPALPNPKTSSSTSLTGSSTSHCETTKATKEKERTRERQKAKDETTKRPTHHREREGTAEHKRKRHRKRGRKRKGKATGQNPD